MPPSNDIDDRETLSGLNIDLIIVSGIRLVAKDRNLLGFGEPITSDVSFCLDVYHKHKTHKVLSLTFIIKHLNLKQPFVEVWFGGKKLGKTQVVNKNLSPTWNKYFKIELGPEDVQNIEQGRSGFKHLSLRIFDYDL